MTRAIFTCNGDDVSDFIERKNGRANPFGWSACDLYHGTCHVATVNFGDIALTEEAKVRGYAFTTREE